MKKIIVRIPDNKFSFFVQLLKNLGFVKFKAEEISRGDSKQATIENIRLGWKEVNLIKQGKVKAKSAKNLLHELRET